MRTYTGWGLLKRINVIRLGRRVVHLRRGFPLKKSRVLAVHTIVKEVHRTQAGVLGTFCGHGLLSSIDRVVPRNIDMGTSSAHVFQQVYLTERREKDPVKIHGISG